MKKISTLGIDLAKENFQVCAMDKKGKVILNKKVKRKGLLSLVNKLEKEEDFLIGMESCGGAHHIARTLHQEGYDARMMSAKFVKPFVKSNKNDSADAEAIAEAVRRPQMRFVGVKSLSQQDIQSIHRVREAFVKRKTALGNEMRGLLMEYGIVVSKGIHHLKKSLPFILEDSENGLTLEFRTLLQELYEDFCKCFDRVSHYDNKLERIAKENESCKRLKQIEGVGTITSTAIIASVGDPSVFKNGREFSSYLGLVPRQHSTGGKTVLLGISKRGDKYIRKNLVHGCRAVIHHARFKDDKISRWINNKLLEKGVNKVSVALANKKARVIWSLLAKGEDYRRAK